MALAEPNTQSAPTRADIVVGVAASQGGPAATSTADTVEAEISRCFPSRTGEVVLLSNETSSDGAATSPTATHPAVFTGGFLGTESALPALLQAAQSLDANACALVGDQARSPGDNWLRLLLEPIVEQGYDFVCPAYQRHPLAGTINTGIVYPLTRALFGKRLRQPMGGELAMSRKLMDHLLRDEEWQSDPVYAGADIWLVTKVLSREFRVCQSFIGPRPDAAGGTAEDLSETLARVVGLLFHEMERHAAVWQRTIGSEAVPTFGVSAAPEGEAPPANIARMIDRFELGLRELQAFWAMIIAPADMLALQRTNGRPSGPFRFDDGLWARVLYDFALGYHAGLASRNQILRAMTPLYLGWVAGFLNEVQNLSAVQIEERIERVCLAFESNKPYLISRWRWPDRFSP